ncbi:MAG: hypothetical protein KKD44_29430 [Proteobacteria bacterium]|nr:hypothetical protein [Pseudomonadota bacterium]
MYAIIDTKKAGVRSKNQYDVIPMISATPRQKKAVVDKVATYIEAKTIVNELNKTRRNPIVTRTGYTAKRKGKNVRVPPTKILDMGKRGKTKKSKQWAHFEKNALAGWSKTRPVGKRILALKKLVKKFDYATIIRRLNQLANVNTDIPTISAARHDMLKMMKLYRPDSYDKNRADFLAKTKQLLAARGREVTGKKNPKSCKKVKISIPSSITTVTGLTEYIADKTNWPVAHCKRQAIIIFEHKKPKKKS